MDLPIVDFSRLEENLGVKFQRVALLEQALVHRSYLNENPLFHLGHNERLEFLGDAVLELVVTEYLYNTYPNPEGELTNWRASLVNAKMLFIISKELGVDGFLFLSKGESRDAHSKARDYILANAFEAIVGALYVDQGYQACYEFLSRILLPRLEYILQHELYRDPKSKFQELAQERYGITPSYRVLDESGLDHAKHFVMGVYLDEEQYGIGEGSSKKEAQEAAAMKAMKKAGWE